jgi:hypothetical protein
LTPTTNQQKSHHLAPAGQLFDPNHQSAKKPSLSPCWSAVWPQLPISKKAITQPLLVSCLAPTTNQQKSHHSAPAGQLLDPNYSAEKATIQPKKY